LPIDGFLPPGPSMSSPLGRYCPLSLSLSYSSLR
jgi:hypothetical protein